MSYPELRRFEFTRNGHSNRRDDDAQPRVLFIGMDFDDHWLHFHLAGDAWVRTGHVYDCVLDAELVAGLEPQDAVRLGIEYQRARHRQGGANE